ncbi:uncharacterized protein B0H18DRAFT_954111 [Fomitopsis serialis]|uniref:uncharacterized protein n=1 Tax=Fomitopsis serialis TaxID=139415 RepID=UPI002007FE02|nr:uncharacterized protein B0H18DRAFT_954111 [Neoantrodia serialis]KAH9928116.1 hypothetical protein B0H18DRAFT_954111 [Neoantrodia serialis]
MHSRYVTAMLAPTLDPPSPPPPPPPPLVSAASAFVSLTGSHTLELISAMPSWSQPLCVRQSDGRMLQYNVLLCVKLTNCLAASRPGMFTGPEQEGTMLVVQLPDPGMCVDAIILNVLNHETGRQVYYKTLITALVHFVIYEQQMTMRWKATVPTHSCYLIALEDRGDFWSVIQCLGDCKADVQHRQAATIEHFKNLERTFNVVAGTALHAVFQDIGKPIHVSLFNRCLSMVAGWIWILIDILASVYNCLRRTGQGS